MIKIFICHFSLVHYMGIDYKYGKSENMSKEKQYSAKKISFLRRAVIASASITKQKNTIHSMTEVDITIPRNLIKEYEKNTGLRISFTGYITSCFIKAISLFPEMNSFISGNKMVRLKNITVSILVERNIDNENVPEPMVIENAEKLTCLDITKKIRSAQGNTESKLGSLTGFSWFSSIPGFLLKSFVKMADRNIKMGVKYGKLAITAAGMFSKEPLWFIPHGSATVLLTIGSIIHRVIETDGNYEKHEHLCLTASFDHDIIDGAPAARFMNELVKEIKSGDALKRILV